MTNDMVCNPVGQTSLIFGPNMIVSTMPPVATATSKTAINQAVARRKMILAFSLLVCFFFFSAF